MYFQASIDPSSPYLVIPKEIFDDIIYQVDFSRLDPKTGNYIVDYQKAYHVLKHLYIMVGNTRLTIDIKHLLTSEDGSDASLWIKPDKVRDDRAGDGPQFILGRPVLVNRCSYIDYNAGKIGFGDIKDEYY